MSRLPTSRARAEALFNSVATLEREQIIAEIARQLQVTERAALSRAAEACRGEEVISGENPPAAWEVWNMGVRACADAVEALAEENER